VEFAGKKISRYKVPCDVDGQIVWRDVEEVNTAGDGAHANWPDRFFAHLVDGYLTRAGNHGGPVGGARAYLLSAQGLYDFAAPVMQSTALGTPDSSF
jgi:hypothetical protein